MKFGPKDLQRIRDIFDKADGDWLKVMELSKLMADSITLPGKAQARGFAAQEAFGDLSPVAYIFFERAYKLGGEDVLAEPSLNPGEDLDVLFEGIPEDRLPASKRSGLVTSSKKPNNKPSELGSMGKVSLVKGTGPEFSIHDYDMGTIEVWDAGPSYKQKRLIWTASPEPNYSLGDEHDFIVDEKRTTWTMVDYIDTVDLANLIPLYGKNLPIYCYN